MKTVESSIPVRAELVPEPRTIEWRNVERSNGPGRELHEADVAWAKAWIWRDSAAGWLLTCNAVLLTGAKLDAVTLDEAKAAALRRIAEFAYQRELSFGELRRLCLT